MALDTYDNLKSSVLDWMERAGQTGVVEDWITLAEARLNRELDPVETSASLTGVVDSRNLDTSALSIDVPKTLWLTNDDGDEDPVKKYSFANLAYADDSGEPSGWAQKDDDTIVLNRPCDEAYTFRLIYDGRFALSDAAPTNWLLTNHPDVYLAACLMWGAGYNEDWPNGQVWKAILDETIPDIRHQLAQRKRGKLIIDPMLSANHNVRGLNPNDFA